MTLPDCCPLCTRLRRDHPGLVEDLLVFPTFLQSTPQEGRKMRDGKTRVIGCSHVRSVFGPWQTMQDAEYAVKALFDRLRTEKEQRRETLNLTFTDHENPTQPSREEATTLGLRQTLQGEAQGRGGEVPAPVAGEASRLPGEDDAAMAGETGLCHSGISYFPRHELSGASWVCSRCGKDLTPGKLL